MLNVKILLCKLKAVFLAAISFTLTTHGKRMVLLSTLLMQLIELHEFNQEKMSQLNNSLKLCRSEDALMLPCFLNSKIWGEGIRSSQMCSLNNNDASCSFIMSMIPSWLRYDSNQMSTDVKKVIEHAVLVSGGQIA